VELTSRKVYTKVPTSLSHTISPLCQCDSTLYLFIRQAKKWMFMTLAKHSFGEGIVKIITLSQSKTAQMKALVSYQARKWCPTLILPQIKTQLLVEISQDYLLSLLLSQVPRIETWRQTTVMGKVYIPRLSLKIASSILRKGSTHECSSLARAKIRTHRGFSTKDHRIGSCLCKVNSLAEHPLNSQCGTIRASLYTVAKTNLDFRHLLCS